MLIVHFAERGSLRARLCFINIIWLMNQTIHPRPAKSDHKTWVHKLEERGFENKIGEEAIRAMFMSFWSRGAEINIQTNLQNGKFKLFLSWNGNICSVFKSVGVSLTYLSAKLPFRKCTFGPDIVPNIYFIFSMPRSVFLWA